MKKILCVLLCLLLPASALAESMNLRMTRQRTEVDVTVPVQHIAQRAPTPEEMAAEWSFGGVTETDGAHAGQTYRNDYEFAPHETLGFRVHEVSRFSKYDGDDCLWTVEIRDYWVRGWQEVREGVLLWGYTDTSLGSYGYPITAWMTLLSHDGAVLWSQPLSPRVDWERTAFVIDGGDGVYTAFSTYTSGKQEVLCVRQIGADGTLLCFEETPVTAFGLPEGASRFTINEAAALEDGHLLHLSAGTQHFLVQVTQAGTVGQVIRYEGEGHCLILTNTLVHGGSLWLSGYLTPGEADADYFQSCRSEVEDVIAAAWQRDGWGSQPVDSEFLVPRIREKYTAVLLRVDPVTFQPVAAYTVDGCLGGALAAQEDGVTWNVESVTRCYYSPMTSSFTISGAARVFRYQLSTDGTLLGGGETDEFVGYLR